ncbi:MAG: hypothetical protein GWP19_03315 [Planctomycetia bacterium]|nr:hypothetical protein [Planctomycetia bacterium]
MASRGRGSRVKGGTFERRIAKLLQEQFDVSVKRSGAQEQWKHSVGDLQPDPKSDTILNNYFWECKNRESMGKALLDWYKKAKSDAEKGGKIPLVVATKNQEDDYVFIRLEDFLELLEDLSNHKKHN